jgi:PAS domain S-box-containing protein
MTKERRCADFYDWFVDEYVPSKKNKTDAIIVSSNWLSAYTKIGDKEFRVHLDALFEKLKGHRVIAYSQPTSFSVDINRYIYKLEKFMGEAPSNLELGIKSLDAVNAALYEESQRFGFEFVDITQLFCSRSRCEVVKDGVVYFWDKIHLTLPGSMLVAELTHGILTRGYAAEPPRASDQPAKDHTISADALMVRNLDGTIRYWSGGAKKLYGWEPSEVLGTTSHQLLKTVFPVPLEVIEEELRAKGRWEGQLIHVRRDGSRVTVASRWDLEQKPYSQGRANMVIETKGPIPIPRSGAFRNKLHSLLNQPSCSNGPPPCQKVS